MPYIFSGYPITKSTGANIGKYAEIDASERHLPVNLAGYPTSNRKPLYCHKNIFTIFDYRIKMWL